jgi:hypothetical protein
MRRKSNIQDMVFELLILAFVLVFVFGVAYPTVKFHEMNDTHKNNYTWTKIYPNKFNYTWTSY